jgi:S-adenosylmethionine:tRNA ribosyltransferase-isomerase
MDSATGELRHCEFRDLPDLLKPGDLVVANNSRVFPARLRGQTASGASVELLLLRPVSDKRWEALARPAKKFRKGAEAVFGDGLLRASVVETLENGKRVVELSSETDLEATLDRIGQTPLPPYIKRASDELDPTDRERYQTVYALRRGSVAAPTAGLHFTRELLRLLADRGIEFAELTLHVGYGTFQPIRTEKVEDHRVEAEGYEIPERTVRAIEQTRARRGRVVAVGTTTVRALESAAEGRGRVGGGSATTNLYIFPGFSFRVVDGLLTNFHLPKSSLYLLVSAFAGSDRVKRAYQEAIRERYRFYSYGDCMLTFRGS